MDSELDFSEVNTAYSCGEFNMFGYNYGTHTELTEQTDKEAQAHAHGDCFLGSNRKIFCGIGSRFSGSIIKTEF